MRVQRRFCRVFLSLDLVPFLVGTELVDVDGDPATTDDQYMPWDFRTNYEYPVLRPYPGSAALVEFDAQFHAPVVAFDNDVDGVDASSTASSTDYTLPIPSSVTFAPGETSQNYVVTIVDDPEFEESEFLTLIFGTLPPSVTESTTGFVTHRLTVGDNDPAPPPPDYTVSFSESAVTVDEDVGIVEVMVTIDPAPSEPLSIPITVVDRTLSDADCTYDKFVYFSPALSSSSFAVTIVNDIEVEGDEYVDFTFDTSALPADVVVGSPGTHRLTVTDDDSYEISFSKASGIVDEGIGTVKVEVRLSGIPFPISAGIGDIEIPIMVEGRTLSGADCTYEEFVTFPTSQDPSMKGAAELISSFVVTIVNDIVPESDEFVTFTFGELSAEM